MKHQGLNLIALFLSFSAVKAINDCLNEVYPILYGYSDTSPYTIQNMTCFDLDTNSGRYLIGGHSNNTYFLNSNENPD